MLVKLKGAKHGMDKTGDMCFIMSQALREVSLEMAQFLQQQQQNKGW